MGLRNIRFYIQKNFPRLYSMIYKQYNEIRQVKSREKKRSFGKMNADKTIYVIRVRKETLGLMGYYMAVLGNIRIAMERNWIPVVDLKNYKNTYLTDEEVGLKNSWEYYFCQPGKTTLEEAYKSKNVVLRNMETPLEAEPRRFYYEVYLRKDMQLYYNIVLDMMKFNAETMEKLDETYLKVFEPIAKEKEKVIGVVSRGTDLLGFPGHSIQPSTEELMQEKEKLMEKYSCRYIFLASDTDKAVRDFKEHFGEKHVLTNDCRRYDQCGINGENVLSEMHFVRKNDEYLKGMEYLTTVWLLSRTDVLYGSLVGATVSAICLNRGEYEHVEIFDKGVY